MRPHFSQTVLIPHFYSGLPPLPDGQPADDSEHFEDFFEEITEELMRYGELEQLQVVENLGEHMIGNVYVKYRKEEEAEACMKALMGRFYGGRMLTTEYSPVTDFNEARCRQFDEGTCNRGGYCNFMHLRRIPSHLKKELRRKAKDQYKTKKDPKDETDKEKDKEKEKEKEKDVKDSKEGGSSSSSSSRRRSRSRSRDRRRDDRDRRSRSRDRERSRKDRSRSRSRGRDDRSRDSRRDDRSGGGDKRSDSRRDDRGSAAASSSTSSGGGGPRSVSEERRAKIASWNKERDAGS